MTLTQKLQSAIIAFQSKNLKKAEQLSLQVLQGNPLQTDNLHLLALIYKDLGQSEKAESFFKKSIGLAPKSVNVALNYANFMLKTNKIEALTLYKSTLKLAPNSTNVILNYATALNHFQQYNKTIELLNNKHSKELDIALFYVILGIAYKNLDQYKEAIDAFDKAILRNPNDVTAWHNKGVTYRQSGEASLALQCYIRIYNRAENIAEFQFNLGCAYYDLADFDRAKEHLRLAVQINSNYIEAHEALNKLLWEQGASDFLSSYKAVEKDNNRLSFEMSYSLANQLILSKQFDKAEEFIIKEKDLHTKNDLLLHSLASIYLRNNKKLDIAQSLLQEAIAKEPLITRYKIDLACVHLIQGVPKDALNLLYEARTIEPLNQEIWAYIGICWRMQGDDRADWLNNYDNFVFAQEIIYPKGYKSLDSFINDLSEYIDSQHQSKFSPLDQSVVNGTQTMGNLLQNSHPLIEAYKISLNSSIQNYLNRLPKDPKHPFTDRMRQSYKIAGCWSVKLTNNGFHNNHVHPKGWLSGPTYITVPRQIHSKDPAKAGWVKFGESCLNLGMSEHIGKYVCPEKGINVLFPSFMWHGTIPFTADTPRITIPCDVDPY